MKYSESVIVGEILLISYHQRRSCVGNCTVAMTAPTIYPHTTGPNLSTVGLSIGYAVTRTPHLGAHVKNVKRQIGKSVNSLIQKRVKRYLTRCDKI